MTSHVLNNTNRLNFISKALMAPLYDISPVDFISRRQTSIRMDMVTSIGDHVFYTYRSLITVDFPSATSIGYEAFRNCYSLTTVILRNTEQVCTLSSTSAFSNCYHFHGTKNSTYNPDGLKDGYIYVPAALLESYKKATNWSTLASQFRAIEEYSVDGTVTGELDPAKI